MKQPKNMRSMETAPHNGEIVDLWSQIYGWQKDVWWDKDGPVTGDGWVTICPRPFIGWRPTKYVLRS